MAYILRQELNSNCNPAGTVYLHPTGVWTHTKPEALEFETLEEAQARKQKEESENRYVNLECEIIVPDYNSDNRTEPTVEV